VQLSDTPTPILEKQIELIRRMTPARKIELVGEMNQAVRELALAGLRHRHPSDSPAQLIRRLADLQLGPELAERVYGPMQQDS
jgi:hypothetical protein